MRCDGRGRAGGDGDTGGTALEGERERVFEVGETGVSWGDADGEVTFWGAWCGNGVRVVVVGIGGSGWRWTCTWRWYGDAGVGVDGEIVDVEGVGWVGCSIGEIATAASSV